MKHNSTTNGGKNPVDRIDKWATGHFDFLLGRNYGETFRSNILKWKAEAQEKHKKFKKPIDPHYPDVRK